MGFYVNLQGQVCICIETGVVVMTGSSVGAFSECTDYHPVRENILEEESRCCILRMWSILHRAGVGSRAVGHPCRCRVVMYLARLLRLTGSTMV
jgi:hypothetical protein